MDESRHPWTMLVVSLIALAALSACSSTPAGSTATTGPGSTATVAPGGPSAPGATVVPTVAPTTSASKALPAVDLVFSGTLNFVAKGSAGRCIVITRSDGTVSFGFEATEADYPGLGTSYSMANLSGDYVDIKWSVDATTAYFDDPTKSPVVLSADHHSVRVDADLAPGTTGGNTAGPEHVSGTITCP